MAGKRKRGLKDEVPPADKAPPKAPKHLRNEPPGTIDPRTKSSGHGKKTADKWNQ